MATLSPVWPGHTYISDPAEPHVAHHTQNIMRYLDDHRAVAKVKESPEIHDPIRIVPSGSECCPTWS